MVVDCTDLMSDSDLAMLLSDLLRRDVPADRITARQPLALGTFPKELVSVETVDRPSEHFFVKYESGLDHDDDGARGGVGYEARVYRELLSRLDISTVRCLGRLDLGRRATVLVLEGLPNSLRVKKVPGGHGIVAAATWLGRFHRQTTSLVGDRANEWLARYSKTLLQAWCVPRPGPDVYRAALSYLTDRAIPHLLGGEECVIHGEFYPKNVLLDNGVVYPVDWESAAIGPGELDLAMLVDGWSSEVRRATHAAYARARWAASVTESGRRRLHLAEMLLHARWLRTVELPPDPQARSARRLTDLIELHALVA